jgi:RNA polymerase sigma-70 factor (sigma-E family)
VVRPRRCDNRLGVGGVCVVVDRFGETERVRRDGFERFAARASPALLRSACLLTRDRPDAEDLLQLTLFRVARRWEAIEGSADAYAYRVLVNLSRDRRRNLDRRPAEARETALAADIAPDATDSVLERATMVALVRRLPAKQREVVVLRFLLDLSVAETAAAVGCSAGTVKSHTSRALASMRAFLAEDPGDDRWMEVPNVER